MVSFDNMTQEIWNRLSPSQRDQLRDCSHLSPQLIGKEGYRVEVLDEAGSDKRRFIVGKSTGWRPCHLEIKKRNSWGGSPAKRQYFSVRVIEFVR